MRRGQDAAAHWPARAGARRPPYIHPELWRTLSHTLRNELSAKWRRDQAAGQSQDAGTQTGAAA
eukprot:6493138-Heterocapsa_arctica.AAC.1